MMMVDPPSGWKYGFPKEYNPATDGNMTEWIVRQGYPRDEMEKLGEHFYVRCWESEPSKKIQENVYLKEG